MFDRVDAFVRDVTEVRTEAQLEEALRSIACDLGFSYFALTQHVDIRRAPQPAIRIHNYPDEWADYFDEERLGPSDPVHRASQLTSAGFAWSRLAGLIELTQRDEEILALAACNGIGDGFTVPAHVPGESNGSCSFATRTGRSVPEDHLAAAQVVGTFAFEAARRLWRMRSPLASPPRLTDRQRDCVMLAARGKTDWEIAAILGISKETASRHVKQARERYGTGDRTFLVVQALFDGTISFSDAFKG